MPFNPKRTANRNAIGKVHRSIFFLIVAAITLGFFGIIGPFILTVLWAVVLAIIFYDMYRWILRRFGVKYQALSAFLTCTLVVLFVLVPLVLLSFSLVGQVEDLFTAIESDEIDPNSAINYIEANSPEVFEFLERYDIHIDEVREWVDGLFVSAGQYAAAKALQFGANMLNVIIQFTLMLYLLFFFLKDGRSTVRKMIHTIPLGNVRERMLANRFARVSKATLKGTVIVAMTQGGIGGVLFWAVGIQAPVLWGVVMTFLALLPVGGSAIVWLPAAIIMFINGQVWEAVIVVIVGALIIGLIDNLLRPLLVGRDTDMPDYIVLVSTLGGLAYFGLSGFVVGPVVAALFITVWEMMGREFGGSSS